MDDISIDFAVDSSNHFPYTADRQTKVISATKSPMAVMAGVGNYYMAKH